VPGASIAAVARQHGVNANLVFAWMRLEEQGLLATRTRRSAPKLLAVTVTPQRTSSMTSPARLEGRAAAAEHLEIGLPDGTCVRVFGVVPGEKLERVLRLLRR
jgi:transposase